MENKNYGTLEYSITRGFNNNVIMNFYIDQRLRNYTKLKEGDRITVVYDFSNDKGIIMKVDDDFPVWLKKTHCPKLVLSSSTNKNGKLKVWFDMNSDFRNQILLPFEIFQEQIAVKITEAKEDFISFSTGKKKTVEQMLIDLYKNYLSYGEPDAEKINKIQEEIRNLSNKILAEKKDN
jgi:hypothetical protein